MGEQHQLIGHCECPMCTGQFDAQDVTDSSANPGPVNAPTFNNDQVISQINSGYKWSGSQITYGFPGSAPTWAGSEGSGFSSFNSYQQAATREIMALWDELIPQSFVESVSNAASADVNFGNTNTNIGYAHAYYPGSYSKAGSVWLNAQTYSGLYSPDPGDYYWLTIIHEVGHALGLSHPGAYNGGSPTYASDAEYAQDTRQWSVMSYFSASNTGADNNGGTGWKYAQTPMVHDILTIQAIYGADTTTRTGDTTYGFNSTAGKAIFDFSQNATPVLTIWDAGGTDTLDLSGFSQRAIIDLTPGSYSSVGGVSNTMTNNLGIAHNTWIENAIGGSGNDTIGGNDLANTLQGLGGNDVLNGGNGNDILIGGDGADQFSGGDGDDWIWADTADTSFDGGAGFDRLIFQGATGSNVALAGTNIELAWGGSGNDVYDATGVATGVYLYGNSGNDTLTGGNGDDFIAGGDDNDLLTGGGGNDTLVGDGGADQFSGGDGDDWIWADTADTSFDGGAGFDRLIFQGATGSNVALAGTNIELAWGGSGNDVYDATGVATGVYLYGNSGNDTLTGGSGNDIIDGGAGNDILNGGGGNDRFVFFGVTGSDTIGDWENGSDIIDFSSNDNVNAFSDLTITDVGGDAQFEFDGNTILALGAAGQFDSTDFLFA
ncbi:M10 family metallopeptidase [Hoeflea sp. TYP-13]|uniref:M10 family metallopeptidase n=1 Tax=Hoeflea sp. TYP-13 TaxID=3230023 RepID=UPI0034C6C5D3